MVIELFTAIAAIFKSLIDIVPQRIKVSPTQVGILYRKESQIIVRRQGRYFYHPWNSEFHVYTVVNQPLILPKQHAVSLDNKRYEVDGTVEMRVGDSERDVINAFVIHSEVESLLIARAQHEIVMMIATHTSSYINQNREEFNTLLQKRINDRFQKYGCVCVSVTLESLVPADLSVLHLGVS